MSERRQAKGYRCVLEAKVSSTPIASVLLGRPRTGLPSLKRSESLYINVHGYLTGKADWYAPVKLGARRRLAAVEFHHGEVETSEDLWLTDGMMASMHEDNGEPLDFAELLFVDDPNGG